MPPPPLLLGASFIALVACAPARSGSAVPEHDMRVHLVSEDCPVGFLRVWYARGGADGDVREAKSDADGVATLRVGPGSYTASLLACGRPGTFAFDGSATATSYRLPARSLLPSLPHAEWSPKPAPDRRRCRLPAGPAKQRLLAGRYTDLRLDDGGCALLVGSEGAEWLYTPDRGMRRLGTALAASGERLLVAMEPSEGTILVDRRTGARTVVSKERRRVALSPHTDVLLLKEDDPQGKTAKLDARWPDGRQRHLSDRARVETAWSDDGRWLAFLDDAPSDGCPTMHVVDLAGADDRAVMRVCQVPGWGLPRFVSDRHVLVSGDAGSFIIDASTGTTTNHFGPGAWVSGFSQGVLVQEGTRMPPDRASLWNLATGATFSIPFRFDLVREVPTGDLVVFRHRDDRPFIRGTESPFDAIFIDTTTGAARLIAEGVMDSLAASAGLLVFEEDERFVALPVGGSRASAFPSQGESVESFSSDDRWVGLRGPLHKATPMWHSIARIDGWGMPLDGLTAESGGRGTWARDRPAFVFREANLFDPRNARSLSFDLHVRFVDAGRTTTIAKNVDSYVLLDDGQIVYAVTGDGVYIDSLDRL